MGLLEKFLWGYGYDNIPTHEQPYIQRCGLTAKAWRKKKNGYKNKKKARKRK